jgi:thiol-disulfide isomerase/thioredoxin
MRNKVRVFLNATAILFGILLIGLSSTFASVDLTKIMDAAGKPAVSHTPGKVVLVFWATWCDDCKEKVTQDFKALKLPSSVDLILVNVDKDSSKLQEYVKKYSILLPVVQDTDKSIRKDYQIAGVPGWAVLDKKINTKNQEVSFAKLDSGSGFDSKKINHLIGSSVFKE